MVDIAAGLVAVIWPGPTALALLSGLYSLIFGVSEIRLGYELRHSGGSLRTIMQDAA